MSSADKVRCVFRKTGGKCFYCGAILPPDTDFRDGGDKVVSSRRNWHIEHKIPKYKGGSNSIENLVPSCVKCNRAKGIKTAEEFLGMNQAPYTLSDTETEAVLIYKNAQGIGRLA